ncbi:MULTISPECIES: LAGLIDADG family homing endonuclease [unclassified Streptomyces]|uniref:LAGLIDADG family homing endonuclease n=1 Tax=unclassified Streptomyces TaxID=2593676 RepID=UPI0033900EEB
MSSGPATKSEVERATFDFYRGFLRRLFDADGHVEGASTPGGMSVRLTSIDLPALYAVQPVGWPPGQHTSCTSPTRSTGRKATCSAPRPPPPGLGGRRALTLATLPRRDETGAVRCGPVSGERSRCARHSAC